MSAVRLCSVALLAATAALGPCSGVLGEAPRSDFEAARGRGFGPGRDGPWVHRLLAATSRDGLTFKRVGGVISDQASAPHLAAGARGVVHLYFTGWTVGARRNQTAVAISNDRGRTWGFRYLELSGFDRMPPPGDPDVVVMAGGRFRMFLTSSEPGVRGPAIFAAESEDGIRFASLGKAFGVEGREVIDSATLLLGACWHLYALDGPTMGMWHATSRDGVRFSEAAKQAFEVDGEPYIVSDFIETERGFRAYGFSPGRRDIRSFVTRDGETWNAEPGARLQMDPGGGLESHLIRDPTVARLPDGTILMVYATRIPDGNGDGVQPLPRISATSGAK